MTDMESGRSPIVYLDMNFWVSMARGRVQNDPRWEAVLTGLHLAVAEGRVVVPLSPAHYLELWHRHDQRSRENVGAIMRDLSGYTTIPSPYLVRRMEVRASVSSLAASSTHEIAAADLIGYGAAHAFGRTEGRFRIVESLATADGIQNEGALIAPDDIWNDIQPNRGTWEWLQLVGTQQILENPGVDRTPEHRYGNNQLQTELKLRKALMKDTKLQKRLWDVLVAQEVESLLEEINEFSAECGIDPHSLFFGDNLRVTPPEAMRAFVDGLPSVNTLATLRLWKHRDLTHPWEQHDWTDMWALSVAVPYCDIVFTERRWTHLVKASGLAKRHGTDIGYGISALEAFLDGLT